MVVSVQTTPFNNKVSNWHHKRYQRNTVGHLHGQGKYNRRYLNGLSRGGYRIPERGVRISVNY